MNGFSYSKTAFLALTLSIYSVMGVFSQAREMASFTANCENYVYISGESTISPFSFRYNTADISGKKNLELRDSGILEISIPIRDFEPSNPMMYGDFLTLMKESEYPRIVVSFSRRQLQKLGQEHNSSCPEIRITIAGITRVYQIECSMVKCSDQLYLSGEKRIRLSDFRLRPPEKLLGLVKVHNEINVNFGFIITFANSNTISAKL
jgi:hypothetical protein